MEISIFLDCATVAFTERYVNLNTVQTLDNLTRYEPFKDEAQTALVLGPVRTAL